MQKEWNITYDCLGVGEEARNNNSYIKQAVDSYLSTKFVAIDPETLIIKKYKNYVNCKYYILPDSDDEEEED